MTGFQLSIENKTMY